jgi:hypothetical protein
MYSQGAKQARPPPLQSPNQIKSNPIKTRRKEKGQAEGHAGQQEVRREVASASTKAVFNDVLATAPRRDLRRGRIHEGGAPFFVKLQALVKLLVHDPWSSAGRR